MTTSDGGHDAGVVTGSTEGGVVNISNPVEDEVFYGPEFEDAGTEMPTVSKVNLGTSQGGTDELVLASACRDDLIEEVVKLRERIKTLQSLAPKANLVKQNNNIISKNRKLVEVLEMKNIEVLNLKPFKEKFLMLSKKMGNEKNLDFRANTKLEITSSVGKSLKKSYEDVCKMHFTEIEHVLFAQLLFLDLSGGNQYQLLSKLLSISSQGIRKCVQSKLKILIDDTAKESKVLIVPDDKPAQDVNENTPDNVKGVKRMLPKKFGVVKAPPSYDASFDGFDQSKYLTRLNAKCKFVRDAHVTYIVTDPRRRCKHKFVGQKSCMMPGCKEVFTLDVTPIGPVIVVSPEYHPYFGTEIWVCDTHVLKSMADGGEDDDVLEQAAVEAEASSTVVRQLFQDEVYYSDENDKDSLSYT